MDHQTISLGGRDYVIVPRDEYQQLARRSTTGMKLPPLPRADKYGNRPAVAFARIMIARSIIEQMNAAGLSQAELARASKVPAATLNRILKASRTADESTIMKIEKAFSKAKKLSA